MTLLPAGLWKTTVRYVFRSYVYLSLSVVGIAIGVAVVVAVDLSGATVSRQLRLSNEAILGLSTHQIVSGPDGVSELLYARVRRQVSPDVAVAPIVERLARIENTENVVTVIGVDPFAEMSFRSLINGSDYEQGKMLVEFLSAPNTAMVANTFTGLGNSPTIGDRFGVDVGGNSTELRIVGIIGDGSLRDQAGLESIVFTDVSTAQELFGNFGMLTRIDVKFDKDATLDSDLMALRALLPSSVSVVPSDLRTDVLEEVTKAFHLNLTALSFLSLMVGVFLIYNTMSFSVVRRRTTMGLLRAIGVTRMQIMLLFVSEAAIFALFSSVLGLLLGTALAEILLHITVRTLSDVFVTTSAYEIVVSPGILVKGLAVGLTATIVAAIVPAYDATAHSSLATMRPSSAETAFRKHLGKFSLLGALLFVVGWVILYVPYESVLVSLCALAFVTLGMTLQGPIVVALISRGLVTSLRGRFPVIIFAGLRSIEASLSRTAVAVCALSLAVAVTIGIGLMIGSFRSTVEQWLDTSLDADIYVSPPSLNSATLNGTLDPRWVDIIESREEVSEITRLYTSQMETAGGQVKIAVVEAPIKILKASLALKEQSPGIWERFQSVDSLLVSESYSLRNNVSVGDSLPLPTTNGVVEFVVLATYRDYSSTRGVLMFHHAVYDVHWQGRETSSIAIYLRENVAVDGVINSLYDLSEPFQNLQIREAQELYDTSLAIFDRTFQLTSVLRGITVVVACIGILSALVAHQIERAREGMIFRAIGLTPNQFKVFMGTQGVLMGIYAGLLAIPLGIVISWFLVNVINHRSFGWEMTLHLDWGVIGEGFLVAIGAATVAGLYPALRRQGGKLVAEMNRDL